MGIYGGSATNTDLNDWQLMHSTQLDSEQKRKAKTKERERAIARAYSYMEQLIIDKELVDPEYAKYKDLPPLDIERFKHEHYIYELKTKVEETDKKIAYYKGKGRDDEGNEATPEEIKYAMDAWLEYMMKLHSREERLEHYNKKYGIKLTIGHILGWKRNPWD